MIANCKDCRAPIDTIRRENGRLVAVNPEPVKAYSASGLTLTVYLPHKPACSQREKSRERGEDRPGHLELDHAPAPVADPAANK